MAAVVKAAADSHQAGEHEGRDDGVGHKRHQKK